MAQLPEQTGREGACLASDTKLPPSESKSGFDFDFSLSDGYISGCSDVADERFKFPREKLVLGQSSSEPDEEERRSVERGKSRKRAQSLCQS